MESAVVENPNSFHAKGTKTIKISKDVYDSLLYVKGMNPDESMTKTIDRLFENPGEYLNSTLVSAEDKATSKWVFKVKSKFGRERIVPRFSKNSEIIRVTKGVYNMLNHIKIHPDESLNMVLFRLICANYENKPVYRIFTGDCGNCVALEEYLKEIVTENDLIKENIFIENIDFDETKFLSLIEEHYKEQIEETGSVTMPLSILYDSDGNEVWYATGWHDRDEVRKALLGVINYTSPKIDAAKPKPKRNSKNKAISHECKDGMCNISVSAPATK